MTVEDAAKDRLLQSDDGSEVPRHRCGNDRAHRWHLLSKRTCGICKYGGYITLAEHQRTGAFGTGTRCLTCWPAGSVRGDGTPPLTCDNAGGHAQAEPMCTPRRHDDSCCMLGAQPDWGPHPHCPGAA